MIPIMDVDVLIQQGIDAFERGDYKEAIINCDKVITIAPNNHEAWFDRGKVLYKLKRFEEAIASYDKALQLKPDYHQAWCSRGDALRQLDHYEDAITSYDEALKHTQKQYWEAWDSRGLALLYQRDYRTALKCWQEGIDTLQPTYSEHQYGCGQLYYRKGNIQYTEGGKQPNPFPDWFAAKDNYFNALKFLSIDSYPRLHLTILQELLTRHAQLLSPQENLALLQDASAKLQRILQTPALSLGQKLTLSRQFEGFNQLQVDALAQKDPTQALELAEKCKNRCLSRLRDEWAYQPPYPTYAQIQTLLTPGTAVLYWHLSPTALTTFILTPGQSPQVFQPKSSASAKQLQEFEDWMKQWKQTYQQHRDLDSKTMQSSLWQQNMEFMLYNRLRNILDINNLWQNHLKNIDQLIFIPHRDLHLLPLHTLFPSRFTITYLPSAQLGLDLQHHTPSSTQKLLSIEDPATQNFKPKPGSNQMLYAELESTVIATLYQNPSPTRITGKQATQSNVTEALKNAANCVHFTGHSYHNLDEPLNSALALSGQDILTLKDIFALDLHPYNLVCLSACETGITSTQDILDEYIGLVSGFLSAGAAHVISTLWTVDEISSTAWLK
jgi:CHAT domain-containing protein